MAGREGAQLYDPDSGTWAATGSMVAPPKGFLRRRGGAAVLLPDGRVLVAGGGTDNQRLRHGRALRSGHGDVGRDGEHAQSQGRGQSHAAAQRQGARNGRLGTESGYVTSAEVYDPASGTWTPTGNFARPGAQYRSATLLSDGMVLVADDYGAEVYDPGTGSWTTTGYPLRAHNGPLDAAARWHRPPGRW